MQTQADEFAKVWREITHGADAGDIAHFEKLRAGLTAFQIAALDPILRARARDTPVPKQIRISRLIFGPMTGHHVNWQRLWARNPRYALLALHAPDGRVREGAVGVAPVSDPAALAILCLRCNDWAGPVRLAALKRLQSVLPTLDESALSQICLFTLSRVMIWKRGGAQAAQQIMQHPRWHSAVVRMFRQEVNGPLAGTLRQLLRTPEFDAALPALAMSARSVFVREVAVRTVLSGTARWVDGHEWQWHDKVFGLRSKVALLGKRRIEIPDAVRAEVMRAACLDPSPRVRVLCADALIETGPHHHADLVDTLHADKAISVQDRMAFYSRKWSGGSGKDPRN